MLTLPEDLIVLAVGAKPRGGPNNGKLPWQFVNGMRGAMLVALALAARVEVVDKQLVVRDSAPLGDPSLDADLAGLVASRGAPVGEWMQHTPPRFVSAYFDRMEAAGLLRSETVWLLFIARRKGYRLADPAYFESLRARLHNAVTTGTAEADPAMFALAGLVHASGLSRLVYPGRENAPVQARLAELASPDYSAPVHAEPTDVDDPLRHPAQTAAQTAAHQAVHHVAHHAVQAAVQASVQAAVHASVHAAVTATSESHHHSGGGSGGGSDSSPSHHH